MKRRRSRVAGLQMLYQMDVSGVGAEEAIALYWGSLASPVGPEATDESVPLLESEGRAFSDALVRGYAEEADAINGLIREVSHHWRMERMTLVDRNILRLCAFELTRIEDVPRRVTLNEAVELAKQFGSEGSAGFVNGVLDRIAEDAGKA